MMITSNLQSIWSPLGSSLLHFLWQGAVIGLIAALVLELMGKGRASVRYLGEILRFLGEIPQLLRRVGELCSGLHRGLFEFIGDGDPIFWRQRYEFTLHNQF
ncbi:MAG TPA: hypothetical protein EYQ08_07320 [Planctomycetes bacterium]|nr:hypothetical protein [Planctomycetota bacterium]